MIARSRPDRRPHHPFGSTTLGTGTLYVVATPIGNRDDLAPRARRVLGDVDVVAAEDTRHTGRLLSHFGIDTPLIALHDHNEEQQSRALARRLEAGESVALVSDAGTPLLSDPGYRLVCAAHEAGIPVSTVPGPSAVTAALSVAGLPTDRFAFEGFLPPRAEARRRLLDGLRDERRTLVFLESVHKIKAALPDLVAAFGADRPAFIGRELTKLHEQCVRGPLGELAMKVETGAVPAKGEFVIVVAGNVEASDSVGVDSADRLLAALASVLPGKQAVEITAKVTGVKRNALYERMLRLKAPD